MSIEFDDTKCRLTDQSDLHVKRYLSQTRTFFREGAWIRDYFKEFFPAVAADEQGELYFDLSSLDPQCTFYSRATLKNSKISKEVVDRFNAMVAQYDAHIANGPLNFNEEISSEAFTLPDPKLYPELYVVTETDGDFRLVILWGLESDKKNGNIGIGEVGKTLEEKFSGRPSVKVVVPRTKQNEDASDSEEPTPSTATIIPEEPEEEAPVAALPEPIPVPKVKQVEKAPRPEKKERIGKVKKQKPPRQAFDWSRFKWLPKVAAGVAIVLVVLIALTEISLAFLGSDLITAKIASGNESRALDLNAGEELVLPGGEVVKVEQRNATVLLSQFPKPGNYRFLKRTTGTSGGARIETLYSNARNDLMDMPVASLYVNKKCVHPGEVVEANVFQSFHESGGNSALDYSISWGGPNPAFETIETSDVVLNHSYSEVGDYIITLLVKDNDGKMDIDSVNLKVVDAEEALETHPPYAPVPDAEILAIRKSDKGFQLDLDIEGTHDIDGTLSTITINWGDGSLDENFIPGTVVAKHLFAKSTKLAQIKVTAVDSDGLKSIKAATLIVDFQSPLLNDKARFGQQVNPLSFHKSLITDEAEAFSMEKSVADEPVKNKKRIRFTLGNPANDPTLPLINVRWEVEGINGEKVVIPDSREIEILGVDGSYFVRVTAETPEGESYELEHRFMVRIKDQLSLPVKVANWFADHLSIISFSKLISTSSTPIPLLPKS